MRRAIGVCPREWVANEAKHKLKLNRLLFVMPHRTRADLACLTTFFKITRRPDFTEMTEEADPLALTLEQEINVRFRLPQNP